MNRTPAHSGKGLAVAIDAPAAAVIGLPVLVTIRVINRGETPEIVSARLNLMEGDVRLRIADPDGTQRVVTGAGGQPDTPLRRVTLKPGEQIIATSNILLTSEGETFAEPGRYRLQAEYVPSPRAEWILSEPVSLVVRSPHSEEERGAAALLASEPVRRALTLAQADEAPDALRELAEQFPETVAGKLAGMVSAEGGETGAVGHVLGDADAMTVASLINAVSTPFTRTGKRLADQFAERFSAREEKSQSDRALRVAKGQPIDAE